VPVATPVVSVVIPVSVPAPTANAPAIAVGHQAVALPESLPLQGVAQAKRRQRNAASKTEQR